MEDPKGPTTAPAWTRRALVLASAALLAGGWILLDAVGVSVPPMARHWPLFLIVGGLASIADYAAVSGQPGALGRGVFGLTAGVTLYFPVLREVPWLRIGAWGPGLYLAIGLGCLATWAVSPRRPPGLLIIGALCVGLAITFWGWGEIPVALYWGGLLVLVGVALVISVLRARERT